MDVEDFDFPPPEDFHSSRGNDGDADSLPVPNTDYLPDADSPPGTPSDQGRILQLHMIVNLTKEEWQDAEIYVFVFSTDEETEFHNDPSKLPDRGVNLHLDVQLCCENFAFHQSEEDIFILEQYWSLILIRFFLFAETAPTGVTLWERDPGPPDQPNVPRQFRFQTQLPESERAQHPSRTSAPGSSGVSPPSTKADYLFDVDWENSYC